MDEKLRGYHLIKRLMKSANKDDIVEPADKSFISDVNLYNIQAKIIKELAKQQSCIIIGKCANHLLRDYDNTVSVYIEAPRAFCVKNVIERLGVTEEEAHRMIYQTSYFSRPCNNLRTYEGHKHGSRRVCDDRRYTTYVVQQIFVKYCPESIRDVYYFVAIPAAFGVTFILGSLLEKFIISRLYGREIDGLLATGT